MRTAGRRAILPPDPDDDEPGEDDDEPIGWRDIDDDDDDDDDTGGPAIGGAGYPESWDYEDVWMGGEAADEEAEY